MIKGLETMKGEYLSLCSGRLEEQLRGERRELFEYLKRGPAQKVTSKLVINVLDDDE